MPVGLLAGFAFGLIAVGAAVAVMVAAPRSSLIVRVVALLLLSPLVGFCAYGFLAAMEPGEFHIVWRFLYAVIFLTGSVAILRLLFFRGRHDAMS